MQQHFIPKFYFKPWLDSTGKLLQFSLRRERLVIDKKHPSQICYQRDINTFENSIKPERRYFLEHWLSHNIDNKAPDVIKKLNRGIGQLNELDSGESRILLDFIVALIIRRPESMTLLVNESPDTLQRSLEAESEAMLAEKIVELHPKLEEFTKLNFPGLIENAGRLLVPEIIGDGRWQEALARRKWGIWDFSSVSDAVGTQLTCDRLPICLGLSFSDENSLILLPIGPKKVLFATSESNYERLIRVGAGRLALEINKSVASCSSGYVYGNQEANSNVIDRMLRARLASFGSRA
jgi:hypothetical protein